MFVPFVRRMVLNSSAHHLSLTPPRGIHIEGAYLPDDISCGHLPS
jgi:hypothetical protein